MAIKVFTLGYEKRTIDEFVNLLLVSRVGILVDVREKAWSHKKSFCKTNFRNSLEGANIEYVHIREAGNPRSIRMNAQSAEQVLRKYENYLKKTRSGIKELSIVLDLAKKANVNVCFTCFERDFNCCHRSILINELALEDTRLSVNHL